MNKLGLGLGLGNIAACTACIASPRLKRLVNHRFSISPPSKRINEQKHHVDHNNSHLGEFDVTLRRWPSAFLSVLRLNEFYPCVYTLPKIAAPPPSFRSPSFLPASPHSQTCILHLAGMPRLCMELTSLSSTHLILALSRRWILPSVPFPSMFSP